MLRKSMVVIAIASLNTAANAQINHVTGTQDYYQSILNNPTKLEKFLLSMPKGGDLHNHHGGSGMAETMINYALQDHLCVDPASQSVAINTACANENLLENVVKTPEKKEALIDAWSMKNFQEGKETGHDHFFNAFKKYNAITSQHGADVLTEIVDRAGKQNETYLEIMMTPDKDASGTLGKTVGWDPDFAILRNKLLAAGLKNIVDKVPAKLDADEDYLKNKLQCNSNNPAPGCQVKFRYLYQVFREQPPEQVFAQLLGGFEIASKDSRVVGINMVQAEDGPISMRDYALQMQMVRFLHSLYPSVHISLHAGELVPGLVNDDGLRFHIHDAVEVAKAERIGHGIDINHETNMSQLIEDMAKKHIAVEINLTSNAVILDVSGKNHPLSLYMESGVPVTLSTDDEGVDRTNLTRQYEIAASTFKLSYPTLKNISRNAITYSFLPGDKLWDDYDYKQVTAACKNDVLGSETASIACQAFLVKNEKASMQWELEKRFGKFENQF